MNDLPSSIFMNIDPRPGRTVRIPMPKALTKEAVFEEPTRKVLILYTNHCGGRYSQGLTIGERTTAEEYYDTVPYTDRMMGGR